MTPSGTSRALFSLAALDAAGAVRILESGRESGMTNLARQLRDQGALRSGMTVAQAADLLWVLSSFDTFDQLFNGRHLSSRAVANRLVALAEHALTG